MLYWCSTYPFTVSTMPSMALSAAKADDKSVDCVAFPAFFAMFP